MEGWMEAWRGGVEMGPAPHSLLSTAIHEPWWAAGFPRPPDADPRSQSRYPERQFRNKGNGVVYILKVW